MQLYADSPFLRHGQRRQFNIDCIFRPTRVVSHAIMSPTIRTESPKGPVNKWKYTVKSRLYREGPFSFSLSLSPDIVACWSDGMLPGPLVNDRKLYTIICKSRSKIMCQTPCVTIIRFSNCTRNTRTHSFV